MANIVQFALDDTSPAIVYSPFGDTLSLPNLNESWNPYFSESAFATAQGVTGNGTSYHVTSRDGASLTIVWTGTAIQLQGNATGPDSYVVTLDGESPRDLGANIPIQVLATISNLANVEHTLTLTTHLPTSGAPELFAFQKAILASNMTSSTSNPNNVYKYGILDDNDVAYLGRWTYANTSNTSYHQSDSVGDRAMATFRGAAFMLQGTTSPQSGNYSVTVDNRTMSYSAKSSFLSYDTLLHYSTGLDPGVTHTVTVTNQGGGTLTLLGEGFGVYSSQNNPTSISVPAPSTSFSKGTIAAFALAGILACLLITSFLYFYFIYRPRKNFQLERERWRTSNSYHPPKIDEAGGVLNITQNSQPDPSPDVLYALGANQNPSNQRPSKWDRRESGKSSFSRWKREVETAVARDSLGIQFHRSSLYSEKVDPRLDDVTVQSTSTRTRSSRSPSIFRNAIFMTSLGRGSRDGSVAKPKGRKKGKEKRRPPLPDLARASTLGSLSYVTIPGMEFTTGEGYTGAPPSYAASISHRNSDSPPSVPRSVTQASSIPTILPSPDKGKARAEHQGSPVTSHTSSLTPPYPVRDLSKEDRGSLMDQSIDETPNVLALRQLLRSLSPRTSRASFSRHRNAPMELNLIPPTTTQETQLSQPQRVSRPLSILPAPPLPSPSRLEAPEGDGGNGSEPASPTMEEVGVIPEEGSPRGSGTFGHRKPISIPGRSQEDPWTSSHGPVPSHPPLIFMPDQPGRIANPSTLFGRFQKRSSRLIPRLTLASIGPLPDFSVPLADPPESIVRDSFMDLSTSSGASAHSHSKDHIDPSPLKDSTRRLGHSTRPQTYAGLPIEERSRWSNSNDGRNQDHAQDEQGNDNGNDSSGDGSSNAHPEPTGGSLTPLAPIRIPSAAKFLQPRRPTRFSVSETSTRSDPVHIHPSIEFLESPTDSIPISGIGSSDVDFRQHSDSDGAPPVHSRVLIEGGGSVRTSVSSLYLPHPPVDGTAQPSSSRRHTQRQGTEEGADPSLGFPTPPPTGLSSPNFLVQRVLGLHSPSPSVAYTTNTPLGSGRFDSSTSQLRNAASNPGTPWPVPSSKDPS